MSKAQAKIKNRLRKQLGILRSQLSDIEDAERAEKYKALIGKCFIYNNGYSSDRSWPLYSRVIGINEDGWLKVIRTQIDCDGKVEMEITTLCGESCLDKEISLNEFCKALLDAQARVMEISNEIWKA